MSTPDIVRDLKVAGKKKENTRLERTKTDAMMLCDATKCQRDDIKAKCTTKPTLNATIMTAQNGNLRCMPCMPELVPNLSVAVLPYA